jgi:molybdenum cofactor cytidylyltransferase
MPTQQPERRTTAIVLAAGAGSRFGGRKLLATLEGRPVLQHVLDRLAQAGVSDVVVVLGHDGDAIEAGLAWRTERRVWNEDPGRGLSSSLRVGFEVLGDDVDRVLVALGDQPRIPAESIRSLLDAPEDRPIVVPVYDEDRGHNPVRVDRAAFGLVAETTGDRGLGPVMAAHPELVREIQVDAPGGNPDLDTQADLVALIESAWAARVRDNAAQVDRFREIPDGTDFYAPVTGLFRADPARTDEPALTALLDLVRAGEHWIDIGAGAGRYALPLARALAPSHGSVTAVDASESMLDALREIASEHDIDNVRTVEARWPPPDLGPFAADVALIAHVGYDIGSIGPFLDAMESVASRLCVAMLMERQPSSIADVFWPPVHGEERVSLPALPEFLELLRARGRNPQVQRQERAPRRFDSRDELAGFLRRQLWVKPGGVADRRFQAALDERIEADPDGRVGLIGQRSLPLGIVTWQPGGSA